MLRTGSFISGAAAHTLISITEGHQKQQNANSWSARVILHHFMRVYSWKNKNCDVLDEAWVHKYEPISVKNIRAIWQSRMRQGYRLCFNFIHH